MGDGVVTPVALEVVVGNLARVVFIQATQIASLQATQSQAGGGGGFAELLVLSLFGLAGCFVVWRVYVRVATRWRVVRVMPARVVRVGDVPGAGVGSAG